VAVQSVKRWAAERESSITGDEERRGRRSSGGRAEGTICGKNNVSRKEFRPFKNRIEHEKNMRRQHEPGKRRGRQVKGGAKAQLSEKGGSRGGGGISRKKERKD